MASLALVTGASTGIGRACAVLLAARGFEVLAGVRDLADAPPGTEALRLDVTEPGDVAARDRAARRARGERAAGRHHDAGVGEEPCRG
jgi:NAD(P)-dependent dehydrogenase (short-subunit alcohol dehydrogenase family)